MNAAVIVAPSIRATDLPAIGQQFPGGGGFYAGQFRIGSALCALIVAPKAEGEHDDIAWNESHKKVAGALSFFDGLANTTAMAEAGSELAKWAQSLRISVYGDGDWYLPSRDELELIYRNLKPTKQENWCYRGDNPSSVPVGYAYMPDAPSKTTVKAFQEDGPEALEEAWYWSSTQSAGRSDYAWIQHFAGGNQNGDRKGGEYRARAVRRVAIQ